MFWNSQIDLVEPEGLWRGGPCWGMAVFGLSQRFGMAKRGFRYLKVGEGVVVGILLGGGFSSLRVLKPWAERCSSSAL